MSHVSQNKVIEMQPEKIKILKDRAAMLAKARGFFAERSVCEVDCPMMSSSASVDVHIDLIRAYGGNSPDTHYLHSSPEYAMKRLLVEGMGDIFQLSHVFRDDEFSMSHNPEFTMAEWYRLKIPFSKMIEECVQFIQLFVGEIPPKVITYKEAFKKYTGINYQTATEAELLEFLEEKGIDPYQNIEDEGKDAYLNIILGVLIQPHLGKDNLCVLTQFPATQAMLSKTCWKDGVEVSQRFEVFHKGLELANGYHELTNAEEHRKRLIHANSVRESLGKETLPIDEYFLKALEKGLPDCCGVSVGFDRVLMLRHNKDDIADVLPLSER